MKTNANDLRVTFNEERYPIIELTLIERNISEIDDLRRVIEEGNLLSVEVKKYRKKRSLDANSYAWVLMSKMADVLRTSKEEVYIKMLERYGQREEQLLSVVTEAVDMIYRATDNHCTEVGKSELNGKEFTHLAILIGSSKYNTKEMSILIDGIVSECKELGIETMTPNEILRLKEEWT